MVKKVIIELICHANQGVIDRREFFYVKKTGVSMSIIRYLLELGYLTHIEEKIKVKNVYIKAFYKYNRDGKNCLRQLRLVPKFNRQLNIKLNFDKKYSFIKKKKLKTGSWLFHTNKGILLEKEIYTLAISGIPFLQII